MSRFSHLNSIPKWLALSFLCIICWGVFGFLAKLGSSRASPKQMQILFTFGMALPTLIALLKLRMRPEMDWVGITYGVLMGICSGVGGLAYFAAMESGNASVVGPVTSLYPLLTVVLAFVFLQERINRVQVFGIILALISISILSS